MHKDESEACSPIRARKREKKATDGTVLSVVELQEYRIENR